MEKKEKLPVEEKETLPAEKKETSPAENKKENPYIVTLSKPYKFEGKEYTQIDLSALRDASTSMLMEAERAWTQDGNASMQLECNLAYCIEVAAIAIGKPIEFFGRLPKKDGIRVKQVVQQDFLGVLE